MKVEPKSKHESKKNKQGNDKQNSASTQLHNKS